MLFTDMEGSTRLLHRLGPQFAPLLDDVRRLLRSAVATNQGIEVDSQGDGFFFVFQRPLDGVNAAVAAQRAIAAHAWPEDVIVRVRMGLHTGEPIQTEDGYVGMDVHVAARVSNAGHGGQVLLSEATLEQVMDLPSEGLGLKDLGTHHLRDLPRSVQLFQVVIPELLADFPPLRALSRLADQLDATTKALGDGRLVIVLGEGANLCGRPTVATWAQGVSPFAPTHAELAVHLAAIFGYPPSIPPELARVSQHAVVSAGQGPLYEEVRAALDADFAITPLHRLLAQVPRHLRRHYPNPVYPLIVSAAYDDTLEAAFRAAGEPFDLVCYAGDGEHQGRFLHTAPDGRVRPIDKPNKYLGVSPDQRPIIMKFHGMFDRHDINRDSFVLTEDDYFDYLTQADLTNVVPVTLAATLRRSHRLFLGYNPRQWNYRMLLHRVWGRERVKYRSWAVLQNPDPVDYQYWRQYDVEILNIGLDDYVGQLGERVYALDERGASSDSQVLPQLWARTT
jgi:class 3 adenylate cyclase